MTGEIALALLLAAAIGLLLGLTGIVGAYGGSALTRLVSPSALMLTFAALMLVVGLTMFRGRWEAAAGQRYYPLRSV